MVRRARHGTAKPGDLRLVVWRRQHGECALCGDLLLTPTDGTFHLHHRQSRSVSGWCACNIIAMHHYCHIMGVEAVHERPARARERGLTVSRFHHDLPGTAPLQLPNGLWVLLTCDGRQTPHPQGGPT